MKEYSLFFFLIKFLFLITSINGFDRINNGFQRLRESIRGRQPEAGAQEEGAVGGIEEGVELMNIAENASEACSDFYSYVCNMKDENNQSLVDILENEKSREVQSITTKTIDILEELDSGSRYDKLSMEKAWYKACMDKRHSRRAGMHLLSTIMNGTGGIRNMNIEDEPEEVRENWQPVASYYAKQFGESAFFKVGINQQKFISIHRPSQWSLLRLNRNNSIYNIDLLFNKFSFYGGIEDIIETKRRLVNIFDRMKSLLDQFSSVRDILTIEQLQERWPSIKWQSLLQDVGLNLNNLDQVETESGYLDSLNNLLTRSAGGSIVNYIHLLYIMDDKVKFYWDTSLNNLEEFELSDLCFKRMPIKKGIGSIIERRNFWDRKILVKEVFENLRKVFIREVHKSWLVNGSKNDALERLENAKLTITDMQQQLSSDMEVSYIFDINFCSMENLMNFNKAQMEYLLTVFRDNQPKLEFDLISRKKRDITFKIPFHENVNLIKIPVEQLMTPFVNINKPIAWNYGYVATKISFELAQILNDILMKLPRNDTLRKKHEEKVDCFYNLLHSHQKNIFMGKEVLAAHCVALKVSYKALNNVLKRKTITGNETLPVLHRLSRKQLFFTSFAVGDCQQSNFKNNINEALRNSKNFAEAFECPPNSFMNPVEKCEMWKSKSKVKRVKTYLQ